MSNNGRKKALEEEYHRLVLANRFEFRTNCVLIQGGRQDTECSLILTNYTSKQPTCVDNRNFHLRYAVLIGIGGSSPCPRGAYGR